MKNSMINSPLSRYGSRILVSLFLSMILFSFNVSIANAAASIITLSVSPAVGQGVVGQPLNIKISVGGGNDWQPGFLYVAVANNSSTLYTDVIASTCRKVTISAPQSFQQTISTTIPTVAAPQSRIYKIWAVIAATDSGNNCPPPASFPSKSILYSVIWNPDGGGITPEPPADSDGDGIPDLQDKCPYEGDKGYGVDSEGCPIPQIDMTLGIVVVSQAVGEIDVNRDGQNDLVAGKPLVVEVPLTVQGDLTPNLIVEATVYAEYSDGTRVNLRNVDPFSTVGLANPIFAKTHYFIWDSGPSQQPVKFIVIGDPNNTLRETDESNTFASSLFDVKNTRELRLSFIAAESPTDEQPNLTSINTSLIPNSIDFIKGSFPLDDDEVLHDIVNSVVDFNYVMNSTELGGRLKLLGRTPFTETDDGWAVAVLIMDTYAKEANPNAERRTLIVPPSFFAYYPSENAEANIGSAVEDAEWLLVSDEAHDQTLGHELGHIYRINHTNGDLSDGYYWVQKTRDMNYVPNLMAETSDGFSWISKTDYSTLFNEFLIDKLDPEMLLLGGIIEESGVVLPVSTRFSSYGYPSFNVGNYTLEYRDLSGQIVYAHPFMIYDEIYGSPLDSTFYSFKSYYPSNAVTAIMYDDTGEIVHQFNTHIELMRDYIGNLPNEAFEKNPLQRRQALLNQLTALENQYEHANVNGILGHIYEIRMRIDQWLVDVPVQDTLQYTKSDVLAFVDEIISRLEDRDDDGGGDPDEPDETLELPDPLTPCVIPVNCPIQLINGDFSLDVDTDLIPDGWQALNTEGKDHLVLRNDNQQYRFSGGKDANDGLVQSLTVSNEADIVLLDSGDSLTLQAHLSGQQLTGRSRIQLTVVYEDETLGQDVANARLRKQAPSQTLETPSLILRGMVKEIRVEISYTGKKGRLFADDVQLIVSPASTSGLMPLPLAP